jgi:hypothetical protein
LWIARELHHLLPYQRERRMLRLGCGNLITRVVNRNISLIIGPIMAMRHIKEDVVICHTEEDVEGTGKGQGAMEMARINALDTSLTGSVHNNRMGRDTVAMETEMGTDKGLTAHRQTVTVIESRIIN